MTESLLSKLNNEEARKWDRAKDISLFTKDSYAIYVGRNSEANDALISTHAHPKCIWFHVEEGGGSHVVLCLEGKEPPPELVLCFAASLAKRFSKSESRKVRFSYLSEVFKPVGAGLGIWKTRTTALINLDEQ